MNKQDIIAEIRAKHGTVVDFARAMQLKREVVYQSINGAGSVAARLKIARLLNKKPSEIWGGRTDWVAQRDDAAYMLEQFTQRPM